MAGQPQREPAGGDLPRHVAIIADGNGRWAQLRGLPVAAGHEAGADNVRARVLDAANLGIKEMTVFLFSTENWVRPKGEVRKLIEMLGERMEREMQELIKEQTRVRIIGRRHELPPELGEGMAALEAATAAFERFTLYIAFNYGGRAEILDAAAAYTGGGEQEFRRHLYAPEMHDPDLIIRTSGEQRISNFMLWQAAYSELVFRPELWPDFSREAFLETLAEYSERRRRFGGR